MLALVGAHFNALIAFADENKNTSYYDLLYRYFIPSINDRCEMLLHQDTQRKTTASQRSPSADSNADGTLSVLHAHRQAHTPMNTVFLIKGCVFAFIYY